MALTREAGKNEKLEKLLTDAGISSVEVWNVGGGPRRMHLYGEHLGSHRHRANPA